MMMYIGFILAFLVFIRFLSKTSGFILAFLVFIRFLSKTSVFDIVKKWCIVLEDSCHAYQFYKVPQFNQHMQENQLYRKIFTYLNSLPCLEDSDFATLFSDEKSNNIDLHLLVSSNQTLVDTFLSARLRWTWTNESEKYQTESKSKTIVLKIRRNDKRRILRPYLQHIHTVFEEIQLRKKEIKLYINTQLEPEKSTGRWKSFPFTHPSTIDTAMMDKDLKNKVKSDLESFLKSKQYYHRLGRVWKRSYLLYGPSGSGKSSFIAGMAKFLSYDVYDVDLSRVSGDSDMKMLLLQTTNKSLIVIEDLDRYLKSKTVNVVSLSGILNFMDGLVSCCGEERVMVFTMNDKDQLDPAVLRPGRIDVHIQFPMCDFSGFKSLASSHLGLKEHKLFPQVEEIFEAGTSLSPAEIGEIMISNRSSPTRALKSVITALQANKTTGTGNRAEEGGDTGIFSRENFTSAREFKKLYRLIRLKSSRKNSIDLDSADNAANEN